MNKVLRVSEHLYRVTLRLYPLEHRHVYGKQMVQTFREMCRDSLAEGGTVALGNLWLETLIDAVASACVEHLAVLKRRTQMSRRSVLMLALVPAFALFTGYVNLNATEVQAPMACILAFSFLSGFLQPNVAWRWVILIAVSVPLSYLVGVAIHYPIVEPPHSATFDPKFLILIIPALVATYAGALLSRAIWPMRKPVP